MTEDVHVEAGDGIVPAADHPMRTTRQGWEHVPRPSGRAREPVRTRVEVSLDDEESAWLDEAASTAGQTAESFVRSLIDKERAAAR